MTLTSITDPVAAAKALRPQIVAARDEIDSLRQLPEDLSNAMAKANLFQLYLPCSMGGPETDPITAFHAVEQVSIADGSAGWLCFVSSGVSMCAGWVPPSLGQELFGNPPNLRIAGSFRPQGTALAIEGGYRVDGRWDFASAVGSFPILYEGVRGNEPRVPDKQSRKSIIPTRRIGSLSAPSPSGIYVNNINIQIL